MPNDLDGWAEFEAEIAFELGLSKERQNSAIDLVLKKLVADIRRAADELRPTSGVVRLNAANQRR